MSAKTREFFLFVTDSDNGVFNILGPMRDDSTETKAVCELRDEGRNVGCCSVDNDRNKSRNTMIMEMTNETHLKYTDSPILQEAPEKGLPYTGRLPKYAQRADKRRLVQMLCKGKCSCTRWAEMNVPYTNDMTFKESNFQGIEAKCLFCGYVQRDNYNWYR